MKKRKAIVVRNTAETQIRISLNLEGSGKSAINTPLPFMDHMLSLFSKHSLTDLKISALGDTHIDGHHLVEDLGIVLGETIKLALGKKKGISRYGNFLLPMDEALSYVAVDLSGRPYLSYHVKFKKTSCPSDFDYSLLKEFFRAISNASGMNLHIKQYSGENNHHIAESIFKGFGKALFQAVKIENRLKGRIPSTKEIL